MKNFKWKIFIITGLVCLLPILLGISLWNKLPDTMAIHFDIYGEADNFASKGFVVFGLPLLMLFFQAICCFSTDITARKYGEQKNPEAVAKWIIPCITVFLYIITLGYGLGINIDIRKHIAFIAGGLFLVTGIYIPKFDYIKNCKTDTQTARKINKFMGCQTVVMGLLFCISIFLPPIATVICIFLLIPYAIISIVYSIIMLRKQKKH
jgi:uncharacterized membrane protein